MDKNNIVNFHYFKRLILVSSNNINSILPPTSFFNFKRILYNWAGCSLQNNVKIVGNSKIHYSNIKIGSDTWIGSNVNFYCSQQGRIIIGERNDIAPFVIFNTGTHDIGTAHRRAGKNRGNNIQIGSGCWIGMGALILSGAEVGQGCIIAAGAVVRGKFPDNVLIAGVPAVIKKRLN